MNNGTAIALMIIGALLILTPLVLGFEMREHLMMAHSMAVSYGHAGGQGFGRGFARGANGAPAARGGRLYGLVCMVIGLACLIMGILRSRPQAYSPGAPAIR